MCQRWNYLSGVVIQKNVNRNENWKGKENCKQIQILNLPKTLEERIFVNNNNVESSVIPKKYFKLMFSDENFETFFAFVNQNQI